TGAGHYPFRTPPSGWTSAPSPVVGMRHFAAGPSLSLEAMTEMNGPKQHRPGTVCALCDAHSKATQRHASHPRTRTQLYLPWIVLFALSLALVPFSGGTERWIAVGLLFGIGAGAALSWFSHQTNRHVAATTLAEATGELKNEADQRVAMVIRQFEWAVNDVANLRDALKRAQDARAVSEANETRIRRR